VSGKHKRSRDCSTCTERGISRITKKVAKGLDGISESLTPILASSGDIGHFSRDAAIAAGHQFLPRNVNEALDAVEQDAVMHAALGDVIHGEWLKVKRSEAAAHAIVVTEWERDLYLEF